MTHIYNQLLKELGISLEENSYEISRQLKKAGNERKALMSSKKSPEENKRLEDKIHRINEAEVYYEKLAQDEKKEDKLDEFDYTQLQNKGRKNRRARNIFSAVKDESASQGDESLKEDKLSFEERYNKITELLDTPDGFDDGLKRLEKLAEDGYVLAQREWGICLNGWRKDNIRQTRALPWFEKAANQGDDVSQYYLGTYYAFTVEDYDKATEWFEKAAKQENLDAYVGLGDMYAKSKNDKKAFYWHKKAAEAGYSKTSLLVIIGECYEDGRGVPRNVKEAVTWYKKAAGNGDEYSCYRLGEIYRSTEELKDDDKAFEWYKKAGEAEFSKAYFRLGECYATGTGTVKDVEKANYWFEKAASAGAFEAMLRVDDNCFIRKN